jgi:hypothetical protein
MEPNQRGQLSYTITSWSLTKDTEGFKNFELLETAKSISKLNGSWENWAARDDKMAEVEAVG